MFDTQLHEHWDPPQTEGSRALVDRMHAAWRVEARAAAERLDAIGELFEMRRAQRGEEADWAVDTWAAVGAEVSAAFRTSRAMAGSFLRYALAMRERLPQVAAVFRTGEIDYRLFQTMVYRTDLITEPAVLAGVDAELAARAARWPSMTQGRLAAEIDRVVAVRDPDAVRRVRERVKGRKGFRRSTAACSAPTPRRSISGSTRCWPPCVTRTRARGISSARMRWVPWRRAPSGWDAVAARPSATRAPARLGRWWSM
jgi:hypothetical protein